MTLALYCLLWLRSGRERESESMCSRVVVDVYNSSTYIPIIFKDPLRL